MPKVPKMGSLNIFVSQKRTEEWSWFFLHADKHQTFVQVDPINLEGMARHVCITQNNKFARSCVMSEERSGGWSWVFMQMSIKVLYKLMLSFLMDMVRHA